jgi:ribosome maturation factor RimP
MPASDALHDRLVELAQPELDLLEAELVELELLRGGGRITLRFAVERVSDSGEEVHIEVGECARVSRAIARSIEAEDEESGFLPGRFTIEVTSPGIFRRLTRPEHYSRFAGRVAKLVLRPGDGPSEFRGTLSGFDSDEVEVVDADGKTLRFPFTRILKAHLDPDLDFGRR